MRLHRLLLCAAVLCALAVPVLAQVPTGTLAGRVDDGRDTLPGVLVTVTSPNLQGARSTTTSANGDYILAFLPPGQYKVRFELQGFQTQETSVKVNAAQTQTINATMPQAKVAEEVTVTGTYETVSTTQTGATTLEQKMVEKLPVARTIQSYLSLAPGVHSTGPSGNWSISGAQSYENLYLINGVVVNENLRGQPVDAYIEDAIQETTTSVSGISAEYGRFAGGVVNVLTKSGGNEMHGSVRAALSKDSWSEKTPLTTSILADTLNQTYEATLGGFILKDKIWYFVAGRTTDTTASNQTYKTLIPFTQGTTDRRLEGKLTFSPTANHRFVGNYVDRSRTWSNYWFTTGSVDLLQIYDRQIPETLTAINYTGVLSDSFFVEGQYSERTLQFQNSGSRFTDLIKGTPIIDRATGAQGNSPTFCGVCEPEDRNNKDYLAKASFFVSTQKAGSHDIIAGVDSYEDFHLSMNHQSGSDWQLRVPSFIYVGSSWFPRITTATNYLSAGTRLYWWPILAQSKGSKFKVDSLFVNDRWRLSNKWSFNLGVRYDKNDATNAWGKTVSNDSKISPRLGVTFDPKADGDWLFTAGYANYVTSLANTGNVGDLSPAGNPALIYWGYTGPAINSSAPYTDPAVALQQVWNWFNTTYCDAQGHCGKDNLTNIMYFRFPGYNQIIEKALRSPFAEEWTLGAVKRLGTRGLLRLDVVHRSFKDLYETTTSGPGASGQVAIDLMGLKTSVDLYKIVNSNFFDRKYDGVNLQGQYNLDRWQFGGAYTWSHAKGNFDGETAGSGPVTGTNALNYYPEYWQTSWSAPDRDLNVDQRHRARVWLSWDAIASRHNRLSVSLLQRFESGFPYGASGGVRSYLYVTNPGYVSPPTAVTYWFTSPEAYMSSNITNTDISFNYSFTFPAAGTNIEIYLIPQVTNVFNEDNVTGINTTVYDRSGGYTQFADFNPFTSPKLIECPQGASAADCTAMGAHWQKGPDFGKPTTTGSYQTPRTFRISVGIRF